MKKSLITQSCILCFLLCFVCNVDAFVKSKQETKQSFSSVWELENKDLISLDKNQLENKIGRKLRFQEKLALNFAKKKLKNRPNLTGLQAAEEVKVQGLAVASLVCGLVGLLVAGIPLGILGIIFGAVSMSKIKHNPELYRGKGIAIAGLIISIGAIIGAAIFLAMMM